MCNNVDQYSTWVKQRNTPSNSFRPFSLSLSILLLARTKRNSFFMFLSSDVHVNHIFINVQQGVRKVSAENWTMGFGCCSKKKVYLAKIVYLDYFGTLVKILSPQSEPVSTVSSPHFPDTLYMLLCIYINKLSSALRVSRDIMKNDTRSSPERMIRSPQISCATLPSYRL